MSLTPQLRLQALAEGRRPDRVPVSGFMGGYAARLRGMSLRDFYLDKEKCIRAQVLAADLHGNDDSPGYWWPGWGGWGFDARTQIPGTEDPGTFTGAADLVGKPSDVERLQVPHPGSSGMLSDLMRFNRLVRSNGDSASIWAGSPTNLVDSILGRERLLRWYLREPGAVEVLYEKALSFILQAADMTIAEFGVDNCTAGISAPLDSNDLISPAVFERFGFAYLKHVTEVLMARGVKDFHCHLCGDHRQNLPTWASLPLPPRSSISIGPDLDPGQVAQAFGHRHITAGNISTTLLGTGSPEEVFEASHRCIASFKGLPGGFVLAPACELPVDTPPVNFQAMIKAAGQFGAYG